MSKRRSLQSAQADPDAAPKASDPVAEHVRWAVANWPQIDPEVEGIVVRVDKINRHFENAFRDSLGEVGLTKEEWKVVMALHRSVRSHGWLCRDLDVSTGAMTNRLDKLERGGLIRRAPDPQDRRGVLLELTPAGEARLEEYMDAGAARERELLDGLTLTEKQKLNRLLSKLLASLQTRDAERTPARGRRQNS
ncbi:MAG TPA: MarR family transcriptional regulator [Solirubrobacteraceae bacterium]|nr:MarR family transcriptional regulator [Solirubrobacteraceae bacterium]